MAYISNSLENSISEDGISNINTDVPNILELSIYFNTSYLAENGTLLFVKFKAIEQGISDLEISDFILNNQTLVCNTQKSNIITKYALYGDVDMNEQVDNIDANHILQASKYPYKSFSVLKHF